MKILDTKTLPCKIEQVDEFAFKITLTQGLNRQIRRMCEHFGYTVRKLKRTRIMSIKAGKMKIGDWRYLTKEEVIQIHKTTSGSSKT